MASPVFASAFLATFVILPLVMGWSLAVVGWMYVGVFLVCPTIWGYAMGVEIQGCRVVERSSLARLLGLKGLAIYPVVFLADKAISKKGNSTVIFRHERIHLAQQAEVLVLPFYAIYLLEETARALRGAGRGGYASAYYDISFEREAYANERKRTYMKRRRPFAWCAYLVAKGASKG